MVGEGARDLEMWVLGELGEYDVAGPLLACDYHGGPH